MPEIMGLAAGVEEKVAGSLVLNQRALFALPLGFPQTECQHFHAKAKKHTKKPKKHHRKRSASVRWVGWQVAREVG